MSSKTTDESIFVMGMGTGMLILIFLIYAGGGFKEEDESVGAPCYIEEEDEYIAEKVALWI